MSRIAALIAFVLSLAPAAQWSSTPYDSAKPITATDWYVAHDAGGGFRVCSAIAQQWMPLGGAGATQAFRGDNVLVLAQGATLHAWSALSNSASTQTTIGATTSKLTSAATTSFCVFHDAAPGTTAGLLRTYSAYTSTWASFAPPGGWTLQYGANVAIVQTTGQYHAYSAYTNQWTTLDAVGALPIIGSEFAAAQLTAQSRYAAFSALRGTWSLSPTYPSSGAALASSPTAAVFAIRADVGSATMHGYAGYSPFTAQWTTSPLVHANASSISTTAFGEIVRIQDSDTSVRYETFGGATGAWQSLTGPNLVEASLREDFHIVRTASGSPATMWAASALVGGGYTSIAVPTTAPTVSNGARGCIVYDSANVATAQAWAYSAALNSFAPPIPFPQIGGPLLVGNSNVFGFNLKGAGSAGSLAQAYSVLAHAWTSGPAIDATHVWATDGMGNELALIRNDGAAGFAYHAFDAHARQWKLAPSNTTSLQVGANSFLAYSPASGVYHAFSAERGDWTTQTGVGAIVSIGATPISREHLVYFGDDHQKLWMFATPERAFAWFRWPDARQFGSSGATSGGTTPYVGVSVRGTPSSELALVYASLALAPAPLSLPGFGGLLDLDPLGAFQLANLGVVDADGVREARIPIASQIAPSTQAWMQAVVVDLVSLQASFAGRATGTRFF